MRSFRIKAEWRLETEYSLEVDSAAFVDIYGYASDAYKQGIKVKGLDAFSSLTINLSGFPDTVPLRVQLLSSADKIAKEVVAANGQAHFDYVNPGKYYVSAFSDVNGNGVWDTGDYDADRQPEAVYYYPREIECKEKWDVTQQWNALAKPLYQQKPRAITKQKPDQAKKLQNRNAERAKQLGIEYQKTKSVKLEEKK